MILLRATLLACACCLLAPDLALASGPADKGPSEALFILQIVLLLATGRLLGEAMQRAGQPAVMGHLLAGILLGPSVLGALWPSAANAIFPPSTEQKAMLAGISQLGVLLLLLHGDRPEART